MDGFWKNSIYRFSVLHNKVIVSLFYLYTQIRLWPFDKGLNKTVSTFANKPSLFNREENLRKFYFHLFADHEQVIVIQTI